jgi:hypothetical protein
MLISEIMITGREDIIEISKNKYILDIEVSDFKKIAFKEIIKATIVLFIDDNGDSIILKNKYGTIKCNL